jgi:oligopeptide transport system substrate-binding protein
MYENNELDVLPRDLPPSFAKSLQTHPDFRMGAKLSVSYLAFNTRRAPFNTPARRRAFIQAMNRALFASYFQGSQTTTTSWIPPGLVGYRSDIGIVAEGRESNLFPPTTAQLRYSGNDTWNLVFQSAQRIVEDKLGFSLKLEQVEWRDYSSFLSELVATRKWSSEPHIFHLGWVADYPDAHSFMNVFSSASESNYAGWSNKRYDELVEQAVATHDENLRAQYYHEAQKILLEEEAVIMPLFFTSHQALVRSRFKGLGLNALDKWYFKNVRIEEESWSGRSFLRRFRRTEGEST